MKFENSRMNLQCYGLLDLRYDTVRLLNYDLAADSPHSYLLSTVLDCLREIKSRFRIDLEVQVYYLAINFNLIDRK